MTEIDLVRCPRAEFTAHVLDLLAERNMQDRSIIGGDLMILLARQQLIGLSPDEALAHRKRMVTDFERLL
ncbi:MAG: hypothetical protein ACLQME_20310 [Alphaproteobacteria bacterium]